MNLSELEQRLEAINHDPIFNGYWEGGDHIHGSWRVIRNDETATKRRHDLHEEYRDLVRLRRVLRTKNVERKR